jgi:protein TonB
LFAFLADKTGGWRVFVRPKLLIGSLIVGLGLTGCNGRIDKTKDSAELISRKTGINNLNQDSIKNKTIKQSKNQPNIHISKPIVIGCYDVVEIKKDTTEVDSNYIYQAVGQMPQFRGGDVAMFQFISKNLIYPPMAQCYNGDLQGHVICRFIVEKDGSLSNISVIRSLDTTCDNEAVKAIKKMPKWIPGKQNGQIVRVYYTIPILFKLE